jgi:hypothetical protein
MQIFFVNMQVFSEYNKPLAVPPEIGRESLGQTFTTVLWERALAYYKLPRAKGTSTIASVLAAGWGEISGTGGVKRPTILA